MSNTDTIKLIQRHLGTTVDGIIGPKTLAAICKALGITEGTTAATSTKWPTQAEVRSGKSVFGKAGDESNLVNIEPPYPLYYEGKPLKTIRVHKLIAEPVHAALVEILNHYGLEGVHRLGLDQYDGCYNYRKTTNSTTLSMHAWGVALDFCAAKNAMNTHAPQASLSSPECAAWWSIWQKHGAVSMGLTYDKDWMHLQFARFK